MTLLALIMDLIALAFLGVECIFIYVLLTGNSVSISTNPWKFEIKEYKKKDTK